MAPIDEFPGLPERILKIITPSKEELEFRSRLYPDVSVIENSKILCTICQKDVKPMFLLKKKTYKHLLLKVAVCKGCLEFYGDGQFSDDDGEDKYCRWCGQGGTLYMCSECPSSFCKKCIKRNFDREFHQLVKKDDWKCFFCNPQRLFKLRALVWAVDQYLDLQKKKLKFANAKTSTPKSRGKTSTVASQKELPNIDASDSHFKCHLAETKECLSTLHRDLKTVGDSLFSQLNKVDEDISTLKTIADLNMVTKLLSNVVDSTADEVAKVKSKLIDHVMELSLKMSKTEEESSRKDCGSIIFHDETLEDSGKDMFDSTAPLNGTTSVLMVEDAASNDSDVRPTIRLRNLSDLIDPKLKVCEAPIKSEALPIESGKLKADKKTETINISSEDENISETAVIKTTNKDDSSKSSNSKKVKSSRRNSLNNTNSKKKEKNCGTDPLNAPSNPSSENEDEANAIPSRTGEKLDSQLSSRAPHSDSKKDTIEETPKSNNEVTTAEESSSSSDPLSEDSSSEEIEVKKSPQKKSKRARSLDSDSDDSETDYMTLLRKRKATRENNKNKSVTTTNSTVKKSPLKKKIESSEDSDHSIKKLCSFSSLAPKRIYSSSEISSDGSVRSKDKDVKSNRKKKSEEPSAMDSSNDDDENDGDKPESDMEESYLCELNINDTLPPQDLRAAIQQVLSTSEEERQLTESEEINATEDEKSINKSGNQRKKKVNTTQEKPKAKKRYFDKLLNMKIDSDSEDEAKKNEESYKRSLEKEANNSGGSDKDDSLIVVKKAVTKKKRRKKMFMDSDESSDENDGDEDQQNSENEDDVQSGNDSKDDDENVTSKRKNASSDSGSSSDKSKKTKKRRRIKGAKSGSSSGSEDSSGNKKDKLTDSASKGRKNIRRVLKEDDLKQTTLAALKAEQERKRRIAEKQEFYNKFLEVEEAEHKELKELVLDFDSKTKEKILVVDPDLVKKLKPHQAEGIKFMWDSCFETVAMAKKKSGSGCILAHCMGLGKTLQVITLIHTLLTHPEIGIRTILVVSPVSTVLNWANEFEKWLKDVGSGEDVNVFHMTKTPAAHRTYVLKDWEKAGGVLIMGYNLLRTMLNPKGRIKPSFKKVYQERLLDPGPDMVICDEGHILKNEKTALSVAMAKMKTRRRIVLTGTPLQNNLVEYHCMVQFVKPDLLGTKKEFTNRFVNPIQNGQFEDSTPHDVRVMKRRAHVLHTMLDGIVQRKDYNVLTPYLPPKYEYVIHLKLSDVQVKLYRFYLLNMVQQTTDSDSGATVPKGRRLFMDFQTLMWICLHPRTLLMKMAKDEKKAELEETDEEGSLKDFIDDESDFKSSSSSSSESFESGSGSEKGKKKSAPTRRRTRGQGSISEPEEEPPQPAKQWWSDLVLEEHMDDIRQSSKLFLFFTILKYCEEIGDKLLVFSQSLYTLDLIEYFLDRIDTESQKPEEERAPGLKGFEGSWAKGLDYFRLDGSSACENRDSWCKSFNRPDNTRARLFLISTRAGGLGINLTGANRVIIFDASWNPSFDVQSLFRIYRFGQGKPCYIYRFLSKGTMEEKIYERQVAKLSTSLRVIDEQQIDRHFSHSALAELYMFDPEGSELQGTPNLPKDRLMAELLQNHKDIILSHHQHDSLLENQEDQELTEEERKAAWTEFESEKTQRAPPINMSFNLGAMASVMVDLRTKLKQQNPQWTEEQLRLGTLQILQRYPEYNQMAPYMTFLLQATQMQQQNPMGGIASGGSYTMNQGAIMPQFPGMTFPNFRYPIYTSNNPQMSVSTGVGTASGTTTQNPMLNSLLVNPKHLQNMQNQAARATLPQSMAANNGTAGNSKDSTNADPIAIIDD